MIAIIALLIALLVPAVQSAREAARRIQCGNNLKQLVTGLQSHVARAEVFPAGTTLLGITPTTANHDWCRTGTSDGYVPWTVSVLPFIEQQILHDKFTIDTTANGRFMMGNFTVPLPNGAPANVIPLSVLQCPSSPRQFALRNNYFGVQGGGVPGGVNNGLGAGSCTGNNGPRRFFVNGVLYANSRVSFASMRDGSSNIVAIGETRWCSATGGGVENFNWLLSGKANADSIPMQVAGIELPVNAAVAEAGVWIASEYSTRGFGSGHPGGCYFARADGSVQFIDDFVDHALLQGLAARSDGSFRDPTL